MLLVSAADSVLSEDTDSDDEDTGGGEEGDTDADPFRLKRTLSFRRSVAQVRLDANPSQRTHTQLYT